MNPISIVQKSLYRGIYGRAILRDRICKLEEEGDSLRDTLESYRQTLLTHQATIAACEAVVREREQTVVEREDVIKSYEALIRDGEIRLDALRKADDELKDEAQLLRETVTETTKALTTCEVLLREREAELDLMKRARTEAAQELDVLRRDLDSYQKALVACEATVRDREQTVVEQKNLIQHYEGLVRNLESHIQAGRDDVRHGSGILDRDLEACRQALYVCEGVVRDREQTVVEREAVIRNYQGVIHGLDADVRQKDITIASLGLKIEGLETELRLADEARAEAVSRLLVQIEKSKDLENTVEIMEEKSGTVMNNNGISAAEAEQLLTEWRNIASPYAALNMRGGQALIEPYIVEKIIHDRLGRIIIATVEGRNWYDNTNSIELPHLLRLGMIRRGDTVFDCGANQGINSLYYSHAVGATGKVIAFDPFPLNTDICAFNARLNGASNIEVIRAGVSDRASSLVVAMESQSVGVANDAALDPVSINLMPLDMFVSLRPSYLKIDVEGAEVNALEGAHQILALEPALYIEVHPELLPRFNRSPMDIFKHVDLNRYNCYIDHPNVPVFAEYHAEFDITEGCALYFVPKSRHAIVRHYGSNKK